MKELPIYFDPMIDSLTIYLENKVDHFTLQTYIDGMYQGPYVQALQEPQGIVLLEAISNEFLRPPLEKSGQQVLLFLGWRFYPESYLPNYTQFVDQVKVEPKEIALKLVRTLHFAYGVDDSFTYEIGPRIRGVNGSIQKLGASNV